MDEPSHLDEALRRSEERFRILTEVMPQLVWTSEPDGSVDFCNSRWRSYTGLSEADILGDGWQRALHPDDRATTLAAWQEASAAGGEYQVEQRLRSAAGEYRWFLTRALPQRDGSGRIVQWYGTCTDIEDRKQAEEALRRSERLYRAVGESIDYGVWVCDPQGRNVYASESFLKLVGLTQEECSEFGWGSVLHPDDAEETIAVWQRCVEAGTSWEREHRFRGVDGEWHHVLARGVPIQDEEGAIFCWAGINLDITAMKRAEAALHEADRKKDEFLAMLSHELRNPLAPLRNAVFTLRLAGPADARLRWSLDVIDRQVEHLTRLVDDLLDVSRITRGKVTLHRETIDLATVVARAVETSRPLIDARRQQLTVSLPPASLQVDADLTRLAQVVANLLNNAAKYTEEGGKVWLAVDTAGDEAVLSVRDTGVGIPAEVLPHVFDLFAQADKSLDRSQGGLGIGLTLARRLVEMHGGRLEAASAGPGQGSEFTVRLPLATPPPRIEAAPPRDATAVPAGRHRILVVDDNADVADSMALLLGLVGHEVRTANDGPAALAAAREFEPRVVLLDIGLPGMNGYEVARLLRGQPKTARALLVAVTGYGQEEDRNRSQAAGFDHHLVKPVDPGALRALLASLPEPGS